MAENTATIQRVRPFQPGESGNPAGKPKGTRHRVTLALEALFEGEAEDIGRKAIEKAKEGDMAAIRLCLERIMPAAKDRPVAFDMPSLVGPEDAMKVSAAIAAAAAAGELTPLEAGELSRLVETFTKAFEVHSLDARLSKLEETVSGKQRGGK